MVCPPRAAAGENSLAPTSGDTSEREISDTTETTEIVSLAVPGGRPVAIVGCGTVGARAARQLLSVGGVSHLLLFDENPETAAQVAGMLGRRAHTGAGDVREHLTSIGAVLIATPPDQFELTAACISEGVAVVSTSDSVADVEQLLGLDTIARMAGVELILGAGFAPGLTDVLAAHAAGWFEVVHEVHVSKFGTAGPACARQHHSALSDESNDFRDGTWLHRPGGSGRELVWFPDPIGGADCYRGALPDALLMHRLFPEADRLSGRVAATRRDRLTSRLPMMRKPHAEAGAGAVRVEVRGRIQGEVTSVVLACMDRPSVAAGAVAAVTVGAVLTGSPRRAALSGGGCYSVGEFVDPAPFLRDLAARGVRCARFEGTTER